MAGGVLQTAVAGGGGRLLREAVEEAGAAGGGGAAGASGFLLGEAVEEAGACYDAMGGGGARAYTGNAEPEGATVVVGGREVVVGGWSGYEAGRRRARWDANPGEPEARPSARYGRRTYITGQDVLDSLVTARLRDRSRGAAGGGAVGGGGAPPCDPLEDACERYAAALEGAPASTPAGGAFVTAGGATSDDVRALAAETDVYTLQAAAEDAAIGAEARTGVPIGEVAAPPPLPPLPTREVPVRRAAPAAADAAIAALEAATARRAAAVEAYRGAVAAVLDRAAAALEGL